MLLQVLLNLGPPDRFDDGLPDYVEQIESDEMGVYGLGNMLSELQPVMTGRRRLL